MSQFSENNRLNFMPFIPTPMPSFTSRIINKFPAGAYDPYAGGRNMYSPSVGVGGIISGWGEATSDQHPTRYVGSDGSPVWNAAKGIFTGLDGSAFSGAIGGQSYTAGKSPAQVQNDTTSRYQPVNIVKSPEIAGATDKLIGAYGDNLNLEKNNFTDFLDAARTAKDAATSSFQSDIKAYNPTDFSNTLNDLNSRYAAAGGVTNANFSGTSDDLNNQYSGILSDLAGKENAGVQKAYDLLPQYDTAGDRIGDAQTSALIQQLSRYKLGSGTPMSLGSDEQQRLIEGVANVRLPLEQQKIQRQYDTLTGLEIPIEQQQAQRGISQLTGFTYPNVQSRYGNDMNLLNTNYSHAYDAATQIQNLKVQTAGLGIQDAVKYMQAIGVPAVLQQQVLGGDISNLSGLSSLYGGSRYQGLQDENGVYVSQPFGSTFNSPGYAPVASRYSGAVPNTSAPLASGNPAQVATPAGQQDQNGRIWSPDGKTYTQNGIIWNADGTVKSYGAQPTWDKQSLAQAPTPSRYSPNTGYLIPAPPFVPPLPGPNNPILSRLPQDVDYLTTANYN